MKLVLDHHYATAIAVELRRRGFDVIAAVERGWHAEDDENLLRLCQQHGRVLLTNNVADFVAIATAWQATDQPHCGIVFTSDASMPRGKSTIGRYVTALEILITTEPETINDQLRWLPPPPAARGRRRATPRAGR